MSNRRERLRKAEKLLRQGRLEPAIAEYVALIEEEPKDWATTNALGDLYVRAKQVDNAVGQYTRIADHFWKEGFFPKAAALYKKILKVKPTDEPAQLRIAEISAQQGKLVDARAAYHAVVQLRRKRGDQQGAHEVVVKLGALDPKDFAARRAAADALVELGQVADALDQFGQLATDLTENGKSDDAVAVLKTMIEIDPGNSSSRGMLARVYLSTGNLDAAREYLTVEVAGDDPAMLLAVAELKLRGGETDAGRTVIQQVIELSEEAPEQVLALASSLSDGHADAAFVCVELLADRAVAGEDWESAAGIIQEFTMRVPRHVDALTKLVDVCVDGSLDDLLMAAQAELADAYLDAGQAAEASVIAEDLVTREPGNAEHVARFRKALVAEGEADPDARIAEAVSGGGGDPAEGLDEFGSDFFDEPEAVAAAPAAAPAPVPPPAEAPAVRAAAPQPAPAAEVATGAMEDDLDPDSLDLSSLFAEGFRPVERKPAAKATPSPTPPPTPPPAPPAAPAAGGDGARGGGMEIDLTSVLGDLDQPAVAAPAPSAAPPPEPPPPTPAPAGAGGMPPAPSIDEVFDQMRGEAAAEAPVEEAAAQQYQLGLSYRQMGRLDEAIGALETAARSPRYRFNAAVMLGRLYFDKQDPARALDWLERAAESSAPSEDDHRALLYHLGVTLERLGESARALAVLMELQADAGEYRDVGKRVGRLARAQTRD